MTVANLFARGWPELYVFDDDVDAPSIPASAGRRWVWSRADAEARFVELAKTPPPSANDYARDVLRRGRKTDDELLLYECLVGAAAFAEGLTNALEEVMEREWSRVAGLQVVARLDLVLLRVPERAAIDARVDKVLAKHGAKRPDPLAEAKTPRFLEADRRNAARLGWLGANVFDRWYLVGDAKAQSYFLATAGLLPGAEAAIREGVWLSRIPDEALAWLAARNIEPPPKPEVPPAADMGTFAFTSDGDEFGFVFLPRAAAEQLQGEDDHTRLCVNVDPISLAPNAVAIYGANGFLFCRTYDLARALTADGAFVAYGSDEDELRAAVEQAGERRWLPLTTVEGPLVGVSANVAFADATPFDLPIVAGTYDVLAAIQTDDDSPERIPLLWLRRVP